jgi:putative tryptophan/tyrosine transport system substrate-binding protein
MRRREFLVVAAGTAVWPLGARAQQPAMPLIGLLSSRSPDIDAPLISIIRQGLSETGAVEGQNVSITYRWAEGRYDRLAALAADLLRQQVSAIVTIGGEPSALAAKATTTTIPIVYVGGMALRRKPRPFVSACRRICRSDRKRRQADRFARRATDQNRAGN